MALKDLVPWRRRNESGALVPLEDEMTDLFRDAFEDFFRPWRPERRLRRLRELPAFAPEMDVKETDAEYVVSADIPGLSRDDIEVRVDEGRLVISGEKKQEEKKEDENYLRTERSYGSFLRSILLPSSVKEEEIGAVFKDGVLEVHLPKTEETTGRKVEIKAAGTDEE